MTVQEAAARAVSRVRGTLVTVVVNLAAGIPAVVPLWMLWYGLHNWPLADLGLTAREPTENDGPLPWLIICGPVIAAATLLWWLGNSALHRRMAANVPAFWMLSAAAVSAPTAALFVNALR